MPTSVRAKANKSARTMGLRRLAGSLARYARRSRGFSSERVPGPGTPPPPGGFKQPPVPDSLKGEHTTTHTKKESKQVFFCCCCVSGAVLCVNKEKTKFHPSHVLPRPPPHHRAPPSSLRIPRSCIMPSPKITHTHAHAHTRARGGGYVYVEQV